MNNINKLYIIQLDALSNEISLYKIEDNIWKLEGSIANTPGNLCLHICGNLNYFLWNLIGNSGYVRNRDKEFSEKNISRKNLLELIEKTKENLNDMFSKISSEDFKRIYPDDKFGENSTYAFVFARLISHLSYHLGQINYHRRITDI